MDIDETCEKIKKLEIQGARNVAIAALDALIYEIEKSKIKSKDALISEILVNIDKLSSLRSTEPMLENLLSNFFEYIKDKTNVKEIKSSAKLYVKNFKKELETGIEKIIIYGTNLLKDKERILTHCHSSTVEKILINLSNIKDFEVYCTETRPLFQGRITAKNLSKFVKVNLIVDSAIGYFMKDIDAVIVGADVVTARGTLINKIGTSVIASVAKEYNVPFYSACELWKYDPKSKFGMQRTIEFRGEDEVLPKEERKGRIKVLNPAFDATDDKYINGYICEKGILTPYEFVRAAEERLKAMK
jgi:ribose 1,5-bisphosphate isomerase